MRKRIGLANGPDYKQTDRIQARFSILKTMRVDSIITIIVRDGTLIGRKDTVLCEDAYRWLLERGQYLSSRVLLFDMLIISREWWMYI